MLEGGTGDRAPVAVLIEVLKNSYGLDFAGARRQILLDCLVDDNGGKAVAAADPDECARDVLAQGATGLANLIECVTNGETYFLRHYAQLTDLAAFLDGYLTMRTGGPVRIWSAGCSSGEEPLSIALVFHELVKQGAMFGLSVLATDVSRTALDKAEIARYGEWSFRDVPNGIRQRYFDRLANGKYRPKSLIRSDVTYARHNLMIGPPESVPFDVVICRNVLIYFDPPAFARALSSLQMGVKPGGILILGPTESTAVKLVGFEPLYCDGGVIFRRQSEEGSAAEVLDVVTQSNRHASELLPRFESAYRSPSRQRRRPAPSTRGVAVATRAPSVASPRPVSVPAGNEDAQRLLERARRLADSGDAVKADALLREVGVVDSAAAADVFLFRAMLAIDRNDFDTAAQLLAALERRHDGEEVAFAYYLHGTVYEAIGAIDDARQAYLKALACMAGLLPHDRVPHAGDLSVAALTRTIDGVLAAIAEGAL